jgi:2,3-dihydroxyphenylpropionate 1,2-dioxygenase
LAVALLERDFDVTVVRKVALDHGFGQTYAQLFVHLPATPVIPVYVNCASPPLPRPGRIYDLGRAIGEQLAALGLRVLFLGSGGLSHSPPSLVTGRQMSEEERRALNEAGREAAKEKVNPGWDEWFLRLLTNSPERLRALASADIDPGGIGAHEVRTWIAAVAAGGTPMQTVAYEPVREWITGMGVVATTPT